MKTLCLSSSQEAELAFALTGAPPRWQERTADEIPAESDSEVLDEFSESDNEVLQTSDAECEVFYESGTLSQPNPDLSLV